MSTAKPLEKEINHYLSHLSTEQKKVVLSVVKTFAGEEPLWDDKKFVTEMNRRFAEMETGKVKLFTLEEAETKARQSYRNKKRRK